MRGVRQPRQIVESRDPDWFWRLLFWPWVDLGLLTVQSARRLAAVMAVTSCVIVAAGVVMWRDMDATLHEMTSAMRAADRHSEPSATGTPPGSDGR